MEKKRREKGVEKERKKRWCSTNSRGENATAPSLPMYSPRSRCFVLPTRRSSRRCVSCISCHLFFFCHKGNASVIVCVHCTIRVNGVKEWELTRRRKKTDRRKSRIIRWRSFDKSRQKRLPLKSTRRTLTSCKVFFVEWMERWPNRVTNVSTKQKLKQR